MDKTEPSFQSSLTGADKEVKRSRIICLASQPDSFASLRPKDQRMLEESGEKNDFSKGIFLNKMGGPRLLTPKNAFLSLKPSFPVKSDKSILNVLRGGIPAQENFLNKNLFCLLLLHY